MDLIYADANLIDQGVLQDYSLDMEYGSDADNTFEVKIQRYNSALSGDNPIAKDFILYVEFTEYGGIVDRIESDTKTGQVILKGRTWHGIMNGKVIEPPANKTHRAYMGDANAVLAQMITDVGLGSLFEASTEACEVSLPYSEVRYEPMYDCILRLFKEAKAKLYCRFYGHKVMIGAVGAANYAQSEEFDSSQVPYKTGRTFNNVNHMVCLGQGDGLKRAIIHLFADDDGKLQPYKRVAEPKQDSDYILDKSQQKVFGKDEIAYIYDYPSAEIVDNYLPLTSQPKGWNQNYVRYYQKVKNTSTDDMEYKLLERDDYIKDEMELLSQKPDGWDENGTWKNYYYTSDGGTTYDNITELPESEAEIDYTPAGGYTTAPWDWNDNYTDYWYPVGTPQAGEPQEWSQVSEYKEEQWVELTTAPIDWANGYGGYYTRAWNGATWVYTAVSPFVSYTYEPENGQTKKPSDWDDNWRSYYTWAKYQERVLIGYAPNGMEIFGYTDHAVWCTAGEAYDAGYPGYKLVKDRNRSILVWSKNKFYTKVSHNNTPDFPGSVWNKVMQHAVLPFTPNYYYKRVLNRTPKWKYPPTPNSNPPFYGYYKLVKSVERPPVFAPNAFYYKVEDRLKVLLENALKKFDELKDTSSLEIDLELENNYDVGDVVGATDELTGEPINKPILRKIIKIKKDLVTVEYEVE